MCFSMLWRFCCTLVVDSAKPTPLVQKRHANSRLHVFNSHQEKEHAHYGQTRVTPRLAFGHGYVG